MEIIESAFVMSITVFIVIVFVSVAIVLVYAVIVLLAYFYTKYLKERFDWWLL